MKVIFITREGYQLSGARVRCYNFARELVKQGIEASVFSFVDRLGAKYGEKELEMSFFHKLQLNIRAFRVLRREKRDTVFVLQRVNYHILAPLLVCFLNKNKFIFDCDDWNIRENPQYYWGFYPSSKMEFLTRLVAQRALQCIAASVFLRDYLRPFNSRVSLLETGVDTEVFCPRKRKDSDKVIFSWLGTAYHPEMGDNLRFVLECFSDIADQYDHVYLDLAGEGKYFDALQQILPEYAHRDKVRVSAWIPADDVPGYLAGCDIGLLPLIQGTKLNQAKRPTKLFEYMAMAKPVVASRIGETESILQQGETGFLAEGRQEFVACMKVLVENTGLRESMGHAARERALSAYSLSGLGQRLSVMIRELRDRR